MTLIKSSIKLAVAGLLLATSVGASAQPGYGYYHHHHHHFYGRHYYRPYYHHHRHFYRY